MEEADPVVKALVRRMTDLNQRIGVCPASGKFRIVGDPTADAPARAHS